MRILHVSIERLRALSKGCPGLFEALTAELDAGREPTIQVLRVPEAGSRPRWYASVGRRVLILDRNNLEAMASAVPIFLVDLVHDLQDELSEVFAVPGMNEGVERLIPFLRSFKKDQPS